MHQMIAFVQRGFEAERGSIEKRRNHHELDQIGNRRRELVGTLGSCKESAKENSCNMLRLDLRGQCSDERKPSVVCCNPLQDMPFTLTHDLTRCPTLQQPPANVMM